jgi:hypothetical protein
MSPIASSICAAISVGKAVGGNVGPFFLLGREDGTDVGCRVIANDGVIVGAWLGWSEGA